ncbi:putative tartrate dehydrogenase/decarboxylase TtuC' [Bifiguratus adelaidae]|uniref:D-malate dehydrogenase (decarboxylating) n=1 Tax=Bifiguratus adelaidae TaxID=1938954 RepID=A0A261XX65_9FUNG|nr:putative tartrate dehydrogenase/decarboxylase TtuC' [Bifiguratus adelaidae]
MSQRISSVQSKANKYKIAVIPGDGIGKEVIEAALAVLDALASAGGSFVLDYEHFDWSSERFKTTGSYMPDSFLDVLQPKDAIFFGAVGDPTVPDHISLWSLLLPIRQRFQQYANVRPIRVLKGIKSPLADCKPGDLDWVIVRENSEGEYAGQGGRTHQELAIFSRHAIRRIFRFAFEVAEKRPRKLLTFVTKSNAQRSGMVLWDEVAYEVAKEYPHVTMDKMLVDAMTTRMVLRPESLDTIVATNLHADILSDLAAALAGSIGIAPTSNLDPTRRAPSMFEPVHGSAPDISGKGIANPIAAFWTAAEMLDWLGEKADAKLLMEAIESVCGRGILTKDLGGSANTAEVTDAVCTAIKESAQAQ